MSSTKNSPDSPSQPPERFPIVGIGASAGGLVDYILPPAGMPAQLIAYVANAFGKPPLPVYPPVPGTDEILKKICTLLRQYTGHDFSQYKRTTVQRRIKRRMALLQIERLNDYLQYLREHPPEDEALFHDLLIGVTSFFRDPSAFDTLRSLAIPLLLTGIPAGRTLRVWVCGCSTGEEAYSIAILLQEQMEISNRNYKVQIFATDIDPQAIEKARRGIYPTSIAADISPKRLERFFTLEPNLQTYRIHKTIRDSVIFSTQDVLQDPPFSRMDLISCRNLLIYLDCDDYAARLVEHLRHSYSIMTIEFVIDGDDITLDVNQAATCGLVLVELLSNAIKHAFDKGQPGQATIHMQKDSRYYELSVSDNGKGFPPGVDWREASSMGTQLIQIFAHQLKGSIELDQTAGTRFTLRFPAG